uniref:Uncharacterized protein n=1 Tax=Thermofilum pendens TaxID=2269 RepID=A0A7C4H6L4_THEPE
MSELHKAVREGDPQRVKQLVERGANVNARGERDWTPLHLAAFYGYLEVVRFLVEKGAEVNARNVDRRIPLHYAAAEGHLEVVRFLVEKGANVNARDNKGWTPLHLAALYGHLEVARLLLEAGADPTLRDDTGRTPADLAREEGYGNFVEFLESWVEGIRAPLIASVESSSMVEGEWGVLRVRLNRPSKLVVEGDVEWMDPGLVKGVVEVPVKAKKAGRMPVAVVAKSSGKEERKVIWVEVAEGKRRVEGAAALCPSCGAPREPGAKYCWRCGAKLD